MLTPSFSSHGYRRGRRPNHELSAPQLLLRQKKRLKQNVQREVALLKTLIPGAIDMVREGFFPEHLRKPETLDDLQQSIDECNTLYFHSLFAAKEDYRRVVEGTSEVTLQLPRLLGAPRKEVTIESGQEGYLRLKNGHTINLGSLHRWFNQGVVRYMYKVLFDMSIPRSTGVWSVLYPIEAQTAFPSVDFSQKCNFRHWYLVECLRNDVGIIIELRFFSPTFTPVFRLEIDLNPSQDVPEKYRLWWTHRSIPLPEERKVIFELDKDGLPKNPLAPLIPGRVFVPQQEIESGINN